MTDSLLATLRDCRSYIQNVRSLPETLAKDPRNRIGHLAKTGQELVRRIDDHLNREAGA